MEKLFFSTLDPKISHHQVGPQVPRPELLTSRKCPPAIHGARYLVVIQLSIVSHSSTLRIRSTLTLTSTSTQLDSSWLEPSSSAHFQLLLQSRPISALDNFRLESLEPKLVGLLSRARTSLQALASHSSESSWRPMFADINQVMRLTSEQRRWLDNESQLARKQWAKNSIEIPKNNTTS